MENSVNSRSDESYYNEILCFINTLFYNVAHIRDIDLWRRDYNYFLKDYIEDGFELDRKFTDIAISCIFRYESSVEYPGQVVREKFLERYYTKSRFMEAMARHSQSCIACFNIDRVNIIIDNVRGKEIYLPLRFPWNKDQLILTIANYLEVFRPLILSKSLPIQAGNKRFIEIFDML